MDHIDEGNNGRLYTSKSGVIKVQKRRSLGHTIMTQKKIHTLLESLISELDLEVLTVPKLNTENTSQYEMEYIQTDKIIYLGDLHTSHEISHELYEKIVSEFTVLWIALFSHGFAAWDIELFLQSNGKVMLLDFDKYGIVSTKDTTIVMPHWTADQNQQALKYFFQNSCFPQDFVTRLLAKGFRLPSCMIL